MSAAAAGTGRLHVTKMHGAGNDFVIVDARAAATTARPGPADIALLCDRRRGVGCDQLLLLETASAPDCAFAYTIHNADGSLARQCGNGVRCLAAWVQRQGLAQAPFALQSPAGPVQVARDAHGAFAVALSVPDFSPAAVPFLGDAQDASVHTDAGRFGFDVVSMGNPHAVIEVGDVAQAPVAALGEALQSDARFPDRCNVGFVEVVDAHRLRLRVYERGAGETLACGSGACAAAVVLVRRGRVASPVAVELPGGTLQVRWDAPDAPVWLSGPTAFVFEGEWTP